MYIKSLKEHGLAGLCCRSFLALLASETGSFSKNTTSRPPIPGERVDEEDSDSEAERVEVVALDTHWNDLYTEVKTFWKLVQPKESTWDQGSLATLTE